MEDPWNDCLMYGHSMFPGETLVASINDQVESSSKTKTKNHTSNIEIILSIPSKLLALVHSVNMVLLP